MGRKLTTSVFVNKAISLYGKEYIYDKVNYVNGRHKVIIGCKIHGDFLQSPIVHLRTIHGSKCSKCGTASRRTVEEVEAILHNKEIYPLEAIVKYTKQISFKCKNNHIWTGTIDSLINQGYGCRLCIGTHPHDNKIIDQRLVSINKGIVRIGDYINNSTKIEFKCKNNHIWMAKPANIITGQKSDCPYCSGRIGPDKEKIISRLASYGIELISSSNYKMGQTASFKCAAGHIWNTQLWSVYHGKRGCGICKRENSHSTYLQSKIATEWLDKLKIEKREKCIIVGDNKYFVDGFDPYTNTVYEFYGTYWHADPRIYKDEDQITHSRKLKRADEVWRLDKIREENITSMGYKLIIMWESDFRRDS